MEKMFTKILFLMDGSDYAVEAAEFALKLATVFQSTVIALNVLDPNVVNQMARFENKTKGEVEIELEENGWKYLYYFEEMAMEKRVKSFIQQETGNPADHIITMARKYNTDMILLPNIGERGGTKGLVHLKLVEQVIEYAPCAVMIASKK